MKRHNLRTAAYPLDWCVLESVPHLIKAIDTGFKDWLKLGNLSVKKQHESNYLVWDENYQTMFVHDFLIVGNYDEKKAFDCYSEVLEKYTRRINRFYESIKNSGNTLFVRMHCSQSDAVDLYQCLENLTNGHCKLIVVNETTSLDFIEEEWNINNTYVAKTYQTPEYPWQGYDEHWDRILFNIRLNGEGK